MGEERNCGEVVQNWDAKSFSVSTPNPTAFGRLQNLKGETLSKTITKERR
jgi:hypothetical protein